QSEPFDSLPDILRRTRDSQSDLAVSQGVEIRSNDEGMRSVSSIFGVPGSILNEVVASKDDMIAVIELLYPYFGFKGTEELEYKGQAGNVYHFRELINDIPTQYTISVHVDPESYQILRIIGVAAIDRGFDSEPVMSEQEAIQAVMQYLSDRSAGNQN